MPDKESQAVLEVWCSSCMKEIKEKKKKTHPAASADGGIEVSVLSGE